MKKQIIYLASLLMLAAVIVALTRPDLFTADAAKKSFADQALIRRDSYGVPHILAETEEAAAFAMGYAQAEDHAVEIARRYLSARGEEAKYTGAGVESDFDSKRYGLHEIARKNFNQLSPLMQRMMNAFAAGFNRYVEKNRGQLPAWIPAFDGVDVLARCRQEVFRFTFNRENLIGRIRQKYPTQSNTAMLTNSDQGFGQAPDGKRVMGVVEHGKPMVGGGDGWTFAVEFSKPVVAYSLTAYGQTTNPASKHSTDQVKLFAKHQYKRAWFTEAEIKANLEREYKP